MRSLFFALCLSLTSFSAGAAFAPSGAEASSSASSSDWGGSLTVAPEYRANKDVYGSYSTLGFFNIAAGLRYQDWNFLFEYGISETQTSGNATLAVESKTKDAMVWTYWNSPLTWHRLSPLLGAGVGAYETDVTTTLSGVATNDSSPWKVLGGASLGVRLQIPLVWFSVEARLLFGDELDPQPTFSGLARVGVSF